MFIACKTGLFKIKFFQKQDSRYSDPKACNGQKKSSEKSEKSKFVKKFFKKNRQKNSSKKFRQKNGKKNS